MRAADGALERWLGPLQFSLSFFKLKLKEIEKGRNSIWFLPASSKKGQFQPARARRQVWDATAVCVFASHLVMRKQSPEVEFLVLGSRSGPLWRCQLFHLSRWSGRGDPTQSASGKGPARAWFGNYVLGGPELLCNALMSFFNKPKFEAAKSKYGTQFGLRSHVWIIVLLLWKDFPSVYPVSSPVQWPFSY